MDEHNHDSHHGKDKCRHMHSHHTIGGGIWLIGWLFTIGFLHLSFWDGVLALIVWPYFLGVHFAL